MQSRLDRNWRTVDLTPNFITPDDKKFFDDCKLFIGELTKQLTYTSRRRQNQAQWQSQSRNIAIVKKK